MVLMFSIFHNFFDELSLGLTLIFYGVFQFSEFFIYSGYKLLSRYLLQAFAFSFPW